MAFENQYAHQPTPPRKHIALRTVLMIIGGALLIAAAIYVSVRYIVPKVAQLGINSTQITATFQPLVVAPTATSAPTTIVLPAPPIATPTVVSTPTPIVVPKATTPLPKTGPDGIFYGAIAVLIASMIWFLYYRSLSLQQKAAARSVTILA